MWDLAASRLTTRWGREWGAGPSRRAAGCGRPGLGPVPHALPWGETWEPPVGHGACLGQRLSPGPQPPRPDPPRRLTSASLPRRAPQTHGSRLRLHRVSPADSGEYVCRVALGSGPLEASVLVTIEASGSGTVVVPGEDPCGGAGRLEEGTQVGSQSERVLSPGAREHGAKSLACGACAPSTLPTL